jgi:hypothetical protein
MNDRDLVAAMTVAAMVVGTATYLMHRGSLLARCGEIAGRSLADLVRLRQQHLASHAAARAAAAEKHRRRGRRQETLAAARARLGVEPRTVLPPISRRADGTYVLDDGHAWCDDALFRTFGVDKVGLEWYVNKVAPEIVRMRQSWRVDPLGRGRSVVDLEGEAVRVALLYLRHARTTETRVQHWDQTGMSRAHFYNMMHLAEEAVVTALGNEPTCGFFFPSHEEQARMAQAVGRSFPALREKKIFATTDGVLFPRKSSEDDVVQHVPAAAQGDGAEGRDAVNRPAAVRRAQRKEMKDRNFNLRYRAIVSANVFVMDVCGRIIAAKVGECGVLHDLSLMRSMLSEWHDQGLVAPGHHIAADVGFTDRAHSDVLCVPVKRSQEHRLNSPAAVRYQRSLVSMRLTVEWLFRSLRGSFNRLYEKMPSDEHLCRRRTLAIAFLHNMKLMWCGNVQMLSVARDRGWVEWAPGRIRVLSNPDVDARPAAPDEDVFFDVGPDPENDEGAQLRALQHRLAEEEAPDVEY